jgi:phosphate uptake regulator
MLNWKEKILKSNNGSPGVNILKSAGSAINRENKGTKIHVRLKKKLKRIEETAASMIQNAYMPRRK